MTHMPHMPPPPIAPHDRVLLRDRPWVVRRATTVGNGEHLLTLEALDGDTPMTVDVVVPPDEVVLLPTVMPTFDLTHLDAFIPWSHAHRILAATMVQNTGIVSGARFGRVVLEAYQLVPTLLLLSKPRPSLLIADDVGLGKTIEAGLAILELMARGRARRILIVTPPGLVEQWRQELLDKFGIACHVIANAADLAAAQATLPAGVNPWDAVPRVITSIDYLKKETVRNRALRRRWDVVIVDEAHGLAESGTPHAPYRTQRTRLGYDLQQASNGLILLTATPHNGYAHAFRSLLALVEPTQATFHGSYDDIRRRVGTAMVRRMKAQIVRRVDDHRVVPAFLPRTVEGIAVHVHGPARDVLTKVSAYCARTIQQAQHTDEAELIGVAMQIIKKRALSSFAALAVTIDHRIAALTHDEEQDEPPSRADLRDLQADIPLTESQSEQTARRVLRSAIPRETNRRRAEVSALTHIRSIVRRVRPSDPKIEALIADLHRVFADDPTEKVIVFTEYRDTLNAICHRLDADPTLCRRYVVIHGGLTLAQRRHQQDRFADPAIRLLIATDAAGEGLNLQYSCRHVIHCELPWNPNRLEQRNGRVDRYGQTRPPLIRYVYYPASPEDDVLATLVTKIERMRSDHVATPDILGVIQGSDVVHSGLTELNADAPDIEIQKERLLHLIDTRTQEFMQTCRALLVTGTLLDTGRLSLDTVLAPADPLLPDDHDLEAIVLDILGPRAIHPHDAVDGVYRIEVPWYYRGEHVKAEYQAATFRRSVAVRFRADEVEFLTPLHPLVQAIAADARRRLVQVYENERGLPPRRLAARTVPASEPPSAVFTWLGRIEGGGTLLEEHLIPIRVDREGRIVGTPDENRRWLLPEPTGNVAKETLRMLFADSFAMLQDRAMAAAEAWLTQRTACVRSHRAAQADILRRDLDRDHADRLREIEADAVQMMRDATGQLSLLAPHPTDSMLARREALTYALQERRADIDRFATVDDPVRPSPLGVLFLVPEGA